MTAQAGAISPFQRHLTLWVLLCMILGVAAGRLFPALPEAFGRMQALGISVPLAVLIWVMIYPMMVRVDFKSVLDAGRHPRGLLVTWAVNWLVKPFTMFAIAWLFLCVLFKDLIAPDLARGYLAGAVLLGAAPCTAMVFVWSALVRGNPAYTVMQVATNDLIILVAFAPIVKLLLGVSEVELPSGVLAASVILFVAIPLAAGVLTRALAVRIKGREWLDGVFLRKAGSLTTGALLLTLVMIFMMQSSVIANKPLDIVLIAVPLVIQTFVVFFLAYLACRALRLPFSIAAPAGMIGASNFFELAVAVAVALFGASSPAALATTVGVLTEVPIMRALVKIANATRGWFRNARED